MLDTPESLAISSATPYFGPIYKANQVNSFRKDPMKKLLQMELARLDNSLWNILEIGSWAGESAILWADAIRDYKVNGRVTCIDKWEPYSEIQIEEAFRDDKIFRLFLYNINKSQHEDKIRYFRGDSLELLPLFRDNFFDMVYIDGSHDYEYVRQDIINAMRVTKIGGIVSGDDLEQQADENPDLSKCHIGVTQAVWDCFKKRVSSWQGFWAMRKESQENYIEIIL